MPQHIIVVDYDPLWPLLFRKEADAISRILGDNLVLIHHIGSTSVPFLAAKPIIDIMPVVKDLSGVDAVSGEFVKLGYEYLGEFGIKGRRYLRKGGQERTHQIHIFQMEDDTNILRHLAFRDYLRSHRDVAMEYAALKKDLAARFPYDIDGYCDGKDAFVKKIENLALAEYSK
ncbi:MAG TPA: GrpB family protein [Candidatus Ornithospirochaeta stercorigallinarum]|nr:GrpB family protein [Candidatus Ornithospirochaeta stercorigallinarum]